MTLAPIGAKRSLQPTARMAGAGAVCPFSARPWRGAVLSLAFLACAATAQVAPRADPAATEFRLVHSFAFGDDFHTGGARPRPPMQASDGRLYGVSYAGGARSLGTVYRVRPGGSVVTVHSFQGSDGNGPEGTLIDRPA